MSQMNYGQPSAPPMSQPAQTDQHAAYDAGSLARNVGGILAILCTLAGAGCATWGAIDRDWLYVMIGVGLVVVAAVAGFVGIIGGHALRMLAIIATPPR